MNDELEELIEHCTVEKITGPKLAAIWLSLFAASWLAVFAVIFGAVYLFTHN